MSYLPLAGYVGQGMNKAAVDQSAAEMARLQQWEANQRALEIQRQQQEMARSREKLAGLHEQSAEDFFAVGQMPNLPQTVGPGQTQPQARQTAGLQENPAVEYDVTPNNSPGAPATPPIREETQAQPQSRAPVNARERDAGTPTPEAAPAQTQEQVTGQPSVTYRPGHEAPPNGRTAAGLTLAEQYRQASPEEQARMAAEQGLEESAPESWLLGALGALRGVNFARKGANVVGANRAQLESVRQAQRTGQDFAAGAQRSVMPTPNPAAAVRPLAQAGILDASAGRPTAESAEQPQAGIESPEQDPEVSATEAAAEEIASDPTGQAAAQAIQRDVTPSGVPTAQVPENVGKYLANDRHITPDMNYMLRQRELTSFLADHHIRTGNIEAGVQMMSNMVTMDQNLYVLQGMQGVSELNQSGDPRRLNRVLTHFNGVDTQVVPHEDGTFHVEQGGQVAVNNLSADQVSSLASQVFSPAAREAIQQSNDQLQQRMMEFQFWSQELGMQLQADIAKLREEGRLDANLEMLKDKYGGEMGIVDFHNGPDGNVFVQVKTPQGLRMMRYNSEQEAESLGPVARFWRSITGGDPPQPAVPEHLSGVGLQQ